MMRKASMKRSVAFGRNPEWLVKRFKLRKIGQDYLEGVLHSLIGYDRHAATIWANRPCLFVCLRGKDYHFRAQDGYFTVDDNRFYYDFSHILKISRNILKDEVD